MENTVLAKVGAVWEKEKLLTSFYLLFLCLVWIILSGCASSNVSRDAASNIDLGVQNAKNLFGSPEDSSIGDTYQNLSQASKGAIIGGTTGAVAGAFTSGVGFIPGAATGMILGASYGAYIDANTTLADRLKNRGVNVIVLGDQILIEIPSFRLFQPWTSHIKPDAYSTLALVTQYINHYTKILVKVSGYTDDTGVPQVDRALSQQQADVVAKFLTESGVDARLLYAVGCGGTRLVTKNTMAWDTDNYRMEITLEKLYV